eukprot:COSAG02_NODE_6295_length_3670_cov_24.413107_2_plen_60_part_00
MFIFRGFVDVERMSVTVSIIRMYECPVCCAAVWVNTQYSTVDLSGGKCLSAVSPHCMRK